MKLYMKQRVFSWKDRFFIKDEQEQDRYYVEGEFWSLVKKLHVYDGEEKQNELAFVMQKLWAWMPRFFIDIDGKEVCQIVQRFRWMRQRYDLEGIPWHVEGDFWAHEYRVMDGERVVMQLSKHWFTWGDSYEMDIAEEKDVLLCVCIVLAIDAVLAQNASTASSGST